MTTLTMGIASGTRSLRLGRYRQVVLIIGLGIVLSLVIFHIVRGQEQARAKAEFERQADAHVAAIQKGIERNIEVLESIGGLYAAATKVERDDFREFVKGPLTRHEEIQALSWNKRVKDSDRASFEEAVQDEGFTDFQITERTAQGQMERATRRAEYIAVQYIEPFGGNQAAVGFDVASNPARLEALNQSRDTGEMVATSRITLVQETGEQFGFLVFKPIYKKDAPRETVEQRRENLAGFAVGVFRIGDLVEVSLTGVPKGYMNIQLADEASPVGERLLYLNQTGVGGLQIEKEQLNSRNELYVRTELDVPGRQWVVLISPAPEFFAAHGTQWAWWVLAGGLLMTFLLMGYLIIMIRHSAKMKMLVAERSKAIDELTGEITGRRQIEEALRESEERFRHLVEYAADAFFLIDSTGRLVNVNRAACDSLGYARDELLTLSVSDVAVDFARSFKEGFAGMVPGSPRTFSGYLRRKDGSTFPVEIRSILIELSGRPHSFALVRDVTERKLAEESLRESEERYRSLVELSPDGIFVSSGGKIVFANSAAAKLRGAASPKEIIGGHGSDFIAPEFQEAVQERTRRIYEGGTTPLTEAKMIRLDGTIVDVESTGTRVTYQGMMSLQVVIRDITDRKRVETALQDSEKRFRDLVQTVPYGIEEIDNCGIITFANSAHHKQYEYGEGELIGRSVLESVATDSERKSLRKYLKALVKEQPQPTPYFGKVKTKKGREIDIQVNWNYKRDDQGRVIGLISIITDITERKRVEDRLRMLEMAVEQSMDGIAVANMGGYLQYVNNAWAQMHGYSRAELRGKHLKMFHTDRQLREEVMPFREQGRRKGGHQADVGHKRRDGTTFPTWMSTASLKDKNGKVIGAVGMARDITERTQAQERLRSLSRRLLEIQESERRFLARELHDEVGQELTGLKLLLEKAGRSLGHYDATAIRDGINIANDLISRVRNLSLDLRPPMLDEMGLQPALDWLLQRYCSQTSIQVKFIHTGLDGRFEPEIETAAYRIVQEGITNIARHAGVTEASARVWHSDGVLGIEIEDRGKGFDPGVVLASSSSTGLRGIQERVEWLGGELSVESTPGKGSKLSIRLPSKIGPDRNSR